LNERELKVRFWDALRSGSIEDSAGNAIPFPRKGVELRVIEEGNFRAFDLVVAEIVVSRTEVQHLPVSSNILTRTALYYDIAISQKCQIDRLRLFPIELKSDSDKIDGRLARQVAYALFTFGNSIIVLDQKHAKRIKSFAFAKALPATVIARTGLNDFEIVSAFDLGMASSILKFNKRNLARLLLENKEVSTDKLARRLDLLQLVIQKLAYSQLYSERVALQENELEFLREITGCSTISRSKMVRTLLKKTSNTRLTDFITDP
jgi:hypothetical protein